VIFKDAGAPCVAEAAPCVAGASAARTHFVNVQQTKIAGRTKSRIPARAREQSDERIGIILFSFQRNAPAASIDIRDSPTLAVKLHHGALRDACQIILLTTRLFDTHLISFYLRHIRGLSLMLITEEALNEVGPQALRYIRRW
jgi:hypothetical protein